ncbi:MAG: hypothetical protein ACR2PL_08810, partial [Dehalococcoidia bacterium]
MLDWPELDALFGELREQNEERWKQAEELREQFGRLGPQFETVGRQWDELQVRNLLQTLNERLLGGLGTLELVQSGGGIEFIAGLLWPPSIDPRAADEELSRDGVY